MSKKQKDQVDELAQTSEGPVADEAPLAAPAEQPKADEAPLEGLKTIEAWAEELGTADWLFAGMKLGKGFAIGQELTREAYEAAVKWAANVDCK